MRSLAGKRAVITGAASGIGRELALELARAGSHVWLLDINADALAKTVAECGALGVEAVGRTCDLGREEAIDAAVAELLTTWGSIDILINNAGIAWYGPAPRMTAPEWDRMLHVNLISPIRLTNALLPTLLSRPESHLVNMASILGLVGLSRQTAYVTTKHALVGFSESLRADLAGSTLRVTCMCPGWVETPLWNAGKQEGKKERQPPRWIATTPQRVARRTLKAMRRNQGLVVMTPVAQLMWRVKRFSPALVDFLQCFRLRRRKPIAMEGPGALGPAATAAPAGVDHPPRCAA